ncbi:MAG: Crp/Fnr family transcriptional regulator [Prolixibacteraceae bacterium]|nr:Crp/Fnr family transcriptional regulator [Prolixibacteraceae bacterium]
MLDSESSENLHEEPKKSIYKYLTEEDKIDLEDHLIRAHVKRNEFIFKEGDMPSGFITLEEGKVKIFKEGVGGREQILRMVKPGGFVSYRALIAHEKHISSAVALEDSIINIIDADHFFNHLLKNSELTLRLLTKLAKELGFSNSRTVTLTQKHIRGRLAESIILLKNKYGMESDGITIKAYLSREDLANLSNMTTSNAIRTLSNFVLEKVIAIDGRKLQIIDFIKLERISKLG